MISLNIFLASLISTWEEVLSSWGLFIQQFQKFLETTTMFAMPFSVPSSPLLKKRHYKEDPSEYIPFSSRKKPNYGSLGHIPSPACRDSLFPSSNQTNPSSQYMTYDTPSSFPPSFDFKPSLSSNNSSLERKRKREDIPGTKSFESDSSTPSAPSSKLFRREPCSSSFMSDSNSSISPSLDSVSAFPIVDSVSPPSQFFNQNSTFSPVIPIQRMMDSLLYSPQEQLVQALVQKNSRQKNSSPEHEDDPRSKQLILYTPILPLSPSYTISNQEMEVQNSSSSSDLMSWQRFLGNCLCFFVSSLSPVFSPYLTCPFGLDYISSMCSVQEHTQIQHLDAKGS